MHLEGAKSVFDTIPDTVRSSPDFDFLQPWFQYHYIFSQYTYPPQTPEPIVKLPDNTADKCKVGLRPRSKLGICDLLAHLD